MSLTKSIKKALSKDSFKYLTTNIHDNFEFIKDKKTFLTALVAAPDSNDLNSLNMIKISEESPKAKEDFATFYFFRSYCESLVTTAKTIRDEDYLDGHREPEFGDFDDFQSLYYYGLEGPKHALSKP